MNGYAYIRYSGKGLRVHKQWQFHSRRHRYVVAFGKQNMAYSHCEDPFLQKTINQTSVAVWDDFLEFLKEAHTPNTVERLFDIQKYWVRLFIQPASVTDSTSLIN